MAWRDLVGEAGPGGAWHGVARQARLGKVGRDEKGLVGQGMVGQGRHGNCGHGEV